MSHHLRLLVKLRDSRQVSTLMACVRRAYVHHCHRRDGFVGYRWQGRLSSPVAQRRNHLLRCGRYIERIPLDAGMVGQTRGYDWSGARAHAMGVANPPVTLNAVTTVGIGGERAP